MGTEVGIDYFDYCGNGRLLITHAIEFEGCQSVVISQFCLWCNFREHVTEFCTPDNFDSKVEEGSRSSGYKSFGSSLGQDNVIFVLT